MVYGVNEALFAGWISLFGTPLTITTDQGCQFESKLLAELGSIVAAKHVHTTPHQPKGNGMIERMHRILTVELKCSPQTPWTLALPAVLLGLRTTFKEDFQASRSEILFGTSLQIPREFIAFRRINAICKPLEQSYSIPHPVVRRIDERTFVFDVHGVKKTLLTDQLKPAFFDTADEAVSRQSQQEPRPSQVIEKHSPSQSVTA
ncbi:hypothetical protein TKK_0002978 [Trichogramma kaykai]